MAVAPLPEQEEQRLATLLCLQILDTPPEERFERIIRVVAAHFDVSIVAINLVDAERHWSKASVGLPSQVVPRAISFCARVVLLNDILVICDTVDDPRFNENPLVTEAPHLRFYAGIPLRSADNHALGTLCIADSVPRILSATELAHLRDFAAWAERELTAEQLSAMLLRQQATEEALRVSEARYGAVIASLSEGIVLQDADGSIYTCNASAERILGLSADQMTGRSSADPRWQAIHEDGTPFPGDEHPAMLALRSGQPQEHVVMGVHKPDETLTWISVNAHPLYHPTMPQPFGVVSSFVDITQRKQYEQHLAAHQRQLEHHNAALTVLAATDGLTGVANKRIMLERLADELHIAQQMDKPLSLILLDVDSFKTYNDSFGHPAGDAVLKQVAQLLAENARSSDLVARYGGEEFVLILPNTDHRGAQHMAERFRTLIEHSPFLHRAITASLGVATTYTRTVTADDLIRCADEALYSAKQQGRNRVVLQDSC